MSIYKSIPQGAFGALMIDSVAYIGDILSFYLDYQVNESFLDSAIEYDNVIRLMRWHKNMAKIANNKISTY